MTDGLTVLLILLVANFMFQAFDSIRARRAMNSLEGAINRLEGMVEPVEHCTHNFEECPHQCGRWRLVSDGEEDE